MTVSLAGKRIFVAGASGAVGRAIAETALESGARVTGSYFRNQTEATRLSSRGILMLQADLSDRTQARRCAEQALEQLGSIDSFVYAAGNTADHTLAKLTEGEWDSVFGVHLNGLVSCAQAVLPSMRGNKAGKIAAIGSLSGLIGRAGQANYSAAKAATVAFIKTLAREEGRFGISANVVCPGFVDSAMTRSAPPAAWDRAKNDSALGTISSVEVVSSFMTWLLSDLCYGVTGQVFQLDSRGA